MSEMTGRTLSGHPFFELSLDLLCVANTEGRFVELSPSWTSTLGWSRDDLMSKPFVDFVHPDDQSQTIVETQRLAAGHTTVDFENRYRCKDGAYKWTQWTASVDKASGMIYAIARDVSAQKEARQILTTELQNLKDINAQLQQDEGSSDELLLIAQRINRARIALTGVEEGMRPRGRLGRIPPTPP